jgi:aspartyl-tRNA(Asn)/glutamyl-tRNA(Gln) amidotransferase subunit A
MLAGQESDLVERRGDYGLDVRMNFALGRFLSGREYVHAQRLRHKIAQEVTAVLGTIDLIATPTTGRTAAPIRAGAEARGESDLVVLDALMRYAVLANLTGLPAISCPVGLDPAGLPIGLQLMAGPFAENRLLRAAFVLDHACPAARPARWHCPLPGFA